MEKERIVTVLSPVNNKKTFKKIEKNLKICGYKTVDLNSLRKKKIGILCSQENMLFNDIVSTVALSDFIVFTGNIGITEGFVAGLAFTSGVPVFIVKTDLIEENCLIKPEDYFEVMCSVSGVYGNIKELLEDFSKASMIEI